MAATMSEVEVNSTSPGSALAVHTLQLRVRYSETDQMGTFYNSRPLEWFECGRTELLRSIGLPYAELEARGVFLPLVESHVEYLGRARYDDLLQLTTRLSFCRTRPPPLRRRNAECSRPQGRGPRLHGARFDRPRRQTHPSPGLAAQAPPISCEFPNSIA